jgi:hypothetical protein
MFRAIKRQSGNLSITLLWKLGMLREDLTILAKQEKNVTAEVIHKYHIGHCPLSEEYLILLHVDLLLGNDYETSNYTTAVSR